MCTLCGSPRGKHLGMNLCINCAVDLQSKSEVVDKSIMELVEEILQDRLLDELEGSL